MSRARPMTARAATYSARFLSALRRCGMVLEEGVEAVDEDRGIVVEGDRDVQGVDRDAGGPEGFDLRGVLRGREHERGAGRPGAEERRLDGRRRQGRVIAERVVAEHAGAETR